MSSYYSTLYGRAFTTQDVRRNYGFDPTNYNIDRLNDQYGLYPVNEVPVPTYDTNLYGNILAAYTANVDGNTYDKSYVLTPRPLAEAQANVVAKLSDTAEYDSIVALGGTPQRVDSTQVNEFQPQGPYVQRGGEAPQLMTSQSYLAAASRIEPYKTIAVNLNAIATQLQADITAVNAATDIAGVKTAYRPTSGDIDITRSGNNITAAEFNTLVNAEYSEMVLVIDATGYIMYYDENNGGFTALGGQLPAGAADVTLFVGSIPLATFSVPGGNATTNFTF